jgi:hypothetical protein
MPVRGAAIGIELYVTDHQAVEAMVAQVVVQWGRVDVLVSRPMIPACCSPGAARRRREDLR